MTINELIEKLQALAADPTSGATLDTPVKIDVAMESMNDDLRTVYVWPQPHGNYVSFSTNTPEEMAALESGHRKYLEQRSRQPEIGMRIEVMHEHAWRAAEIVGLEPSKLLVALGGSILSYWLADRERLWRFAG